MALSGIGLVALIWASSGDWVNRDSQIFALGYKKWNPIIFAPFVVTFLIAKVLDKVMGLRVAPEVETMGIDTTEHAETGYDLSHVAYSSYGVKQTLIVPTREEADA